MKSEMKDIKETLKVFTTFMMDHNNIPNSLPTQKDTSTPIDPTTAFPSNRRDPPLEGGNSIEIGGI